VVRRFDFMLPQVFIDLLKALSKIHIGSDGWTTEGGERGFLGVVVHYIDSAGDLRYLPIALPQLTGAHTDKKIVKVVSKTLHQFGINSRTVCYLMLGNATNNGTAVLSIAQ
jgi:hypothetical protein